MPRRLALCVGISQYDRHDSIAACATDAQSVAKALGLELGADAIGLRWTKSASVLTGDVPQELLIRHIQGLLDKPLESEHALLYFSGHGFLSDTGPHKGDLLLASSEDLAHSDPMDDGQPVRAGLWASDLKKMVEGTKAQTVTIVLDCCHAGAMTNVAFPDSVAVLAGCQANREAISRGSGEFTDLLLAGLNGSARDGVGNITIPSLYSYIAAITSQLNVTPAVRFQSDSFVVIAQSSNALAAADLDFLVTRFPGKASRLPVTPEHEAPRGSKRRMRTRWPGQSLDATQEEMETIKRLRNAGLVDVGPEFSDLYWACVGVDKNGRKKDERGNRVQGYVELTPAGRYYQETHQTPVAN